MKAKHFETLAETLVALKPLHGRLHAVGAELARAYYDQSGEWRHTFGGDAASEELVAIEEIDSHLEDSMEKLRQFVFLFSENPDFAMIMSEDHVPVEPLPNKLPSKAEIMSQPRRPGALPYPFLKRLDGGE